MVVSQQGVENMDHLVHMALVEEMQVVDHERCRPLKTELLNHRPDVVQAQRCVGDPGGQQRLSIAQLIHRRPAHLRVALLGGPCSQQRGFSNAGKTPDNGMPVVVQKFVK